MAEKIMEIMEIPEKEMISDTSAPEMRSISEKQKEMISEKSTPEERAITGKLKELILELKSKRLRQEESSQEIGKRQKVFRFFSEEAEPEAEEEYEDEDEEDPRYQEEARRICVEIEKYENIVSKGMNRNKELERLIWKKIWRHEEKKKKWKERLILTEINKYLQGIKSGEKVDKEKERHMDEKLSKLHTKKPQSRKKVVLSEEEREKDRQIWEEVWRRQKELFFVLDEEEQKKMENEIYEFLWNHQKQYLTEEEKKIKIKERQTYLEMREKAKEDPNVPFFPFGPGCVLPNFEGNYEGWAELRRKMEEDRGIIRGMPPNLPSLPPLPWDNRRTVPLTPEFAQQFEQQLARCTTVSPVVISKEEKREKLAAEGRCLDGSYLTPYCKCDDASRSCVGFKPSYSPEVAPIWLAYHRQIRQSHCFDIDDHPVSAFGASVGPLAPMHDFNGQGELLRELANRAILEYNEKEGNLLKIEKVNFSITGYYLYWMTVKVLNLTLGTPIETFQVHAGKKVINDEDKVIYCCRPKEECFDIDNFPPSVFGAGIRPLAPSHDFNGKAESMMELATRAILEYNEKECNVFKYKLLKIEKVNFTITGYYEYWMTVKVLNVTLGTPTETFQVHAGRSTLDDEDKVIYCCRPKEEAIVGLPSCELCFGLLHKEEEAT